MKPTLSAIVSIMFLFLNCSAAFSAEDDDALIGARFKQLVEELTQQNDGTGVPKIGVPQEETQEWGEAGEAYDQAFDPDDFDIPVVLNKAVDRYIKYFTVTNREVFTRWLKRTRRYAPVVREILKKHGLPEDLVYLAMIESGFNMKAYSRMKASGPWQFIHETGERYGLRVNYWVDERRDLEKSTVAAARYLKALFDQFGCWHLAAAGYNAGEGRVERAIEKYDTKDFWKLRDSGALPKETREYVPQLLAAAIIAKDPERFGFTDLDSPSYELTEITVPGGIPLKGIAQAGSLELTDLKLLNPEMLKGITPPNQKVYQLKLPGDADPDAIALRLQTGLKNSKRIVGVVSHCVKKKDSLKSICRRYGIDHSDLALLNGDAEGLTIRKGSVLQIPRFARVERTNTTVASRDDDADVITLGRAKGAKKRVAPRAAGPRLASHSVKKANKAITVQYHRVKKGDSLGSISKRYGMSEDRLKRMNGLKRNSIMAGLRLKVD